MEFRIENMEVSREHSTFINKIEVRASTYITPAFAAHNNITNIMELIGPNKTLIPGDLKRLGGGIFNALMHLTDEIRSLKWGLDSTLDFRPDYLWREFRDPKKHLDGIAIVLNQEQIYRLLVSILMEIDDIKTTVENAVSK